MRQCLGVRQSSAAFTKSHDSLTPRGHRISVSHRKRQRTGAVQNLAASAEASHYATVSWSAAVLCCFYEVSRLIDTPWTSNIRLPSKAPDYRRSPKSCG